MNHSVTALLTLADAAERLAVSPASVRRLIQAGKLPVVKLGRLTRIDPSDLDALVYASKARPALQEESCRSINAGPSGGSASPRPMGEKYANLLKLPINDRRRNTTTGAKPSCGGSPSSASAPATSGNKPS